LPELKREVEHCTCEFETKEIIVRVIAGKYRSRRLRSLRGLEIRPTSDRLRETLFDVLCAGNPHVLEGTVWIDLFAGTGAVGIEALSRGANMVYFVESWAPAIELICRNLSSLGIHAGFEVVRHNASHALQRIQQQGVVTDFIFLDPPYRMEQEYGEVLRLLSQSKLLKPNTLVITQHQRHFDPGAAVGALRRSRTLQQGDAALSFYRKNH
jgi:16S rRNA (guanine966-N2)-methyltransferase